MFERQKIPLGKLPEVLVTKWDESILDEGFVALPKRLLRCLPELFKGKNGMKQLAAILSVVDFKPPRQTRLPSLDYLAFIAGTTTEEFRKRIDELEQKGWVTTAGSAEEFDVSIENFVKMVVSLTHDE